MARTQTATTIAKRIVTKQKIKQQRMLIDAKIARQLGDMRLRRGDSVLCNERWWGKVVRIDGDAKVLLVRLTNYLRTVDLGLRWLRRDEVVYTPDEETIRERCEIIRRGWTATERRSRDCYHVGPVECHRQEKIYAGRRRMKEVETVA